MPFRLLFALFAGLQSPPADVEIHAPYVETPHEVVEEMLKLAQVGRDDVVYDLGCGDGRIVIAAARKYGARGVGVDLSAERVRVAKESAARHGVAGRVEFREADIFDTDISKATVVMLYLLPDVNLKLRPKLLAELKPAARVVSHSFHMGDWKPDREVDVHGTKLYYWEIRQATPKF